MTPEEIEEYLLEGCPDDFICPLSLVMMTTPVVANDGITYDKTSLQQHIDYAAQRKLSATRPLRSSSCTQRLLLTPPLRIVH